MIISVASGKGGTGKTLVSTNLAAALQSDISFLDCDVEEPNAHLFLKPDYRSCQDVFTCVPAVSQQDCTLCGKCADICRYSAVTLVGGSILIFPELCHGCGGCLEVCPTSCISEGERKLGHIDSGMSNGISFHRGVLRIGEAMSPPLINKLRAVGESGPTIIIDAPPGTSCPVIAAMKGANFIVLVTEPTPFGLHDLILAHQTVKQLGIPCGLVINRAGLGDDSVHHYAIKHNLPILLEIPFSREIAELYSRGQLLVEKKNEWKRMFTKLFTDIEERVGRSLEEVQR